MNTIACPLCSLTQTPCRVSGMFWPPPDLPDGTPVTEVHGAIMDVFTDGVCDHCDRGRHELDELRGVRLGPRCRWFLREMLNAEYHRVAVTDAEASRSENTARAAAARRLRAAKLAFALQDYARGMRWCQHVQLTPLGLSVAQHLRDLPDDARVRWDRSIPAIEAELLLPCDKLLERAAVRLGGSCELAGDAARPVLRGLREAARVALGRIAPDLLAACGPANDGSIVDTIAASFLGIESVFPSPSLTPVPGPAAPKAAESTDLGLL